MRAVRFLTDRTEERVNGRTFEKGSVHLLADPSAAHWVKRGHAEYVSDVFTPDPVSLPPDPVVTTDGSPDEAEVRAAAEAVIAETDKLLLEPPLAEKTDGDAVGSATADVAGKDSASPGIGAVAIAPATFNTTSSSRAPVRGNRR